MTFENYLKADALQGHYFNVSLYLLIVGVVFFLASALYIIRADHHDQTANYLCAGIFVVGFCLFIGGIFCYDKSDSINMSADSVYNAAFVDKTVKYTSYQKVSDSGDNYYLIGGKRYDVNKTKVKMISSSNNKTGQTIVKVTTPELKPGLSKYDKRALRTALDNDNKLSAYQAYQTVNGSKALTSSSEPSLKSLVNDYRKLNTKIVIEKD